jgi:hypothetical protein
MGEEYLRLASSRVFAAGAPTARDDAFEGDRSPPEG